MKLPGRNDLCPCNSGRKYKHCCYAQDRARAGRAGEEAAAARTALQQAVQFQQAGQLREAEACYQQVLQLNPNLSRADLAGIHYNLGIVLQDQSRPEEAVSCYRRALEIQPRSVEIAGNLAGALKASGQLEGAAAAYRTALAIAPGDALLHYNLGNVLRDLGRFDEAVASLRQALARDAKNPDAHLCLGFALSERHDLPGAAASFRAALRLKPDWVPALLSLGNALRDLGKPDEAIACYRTAPVLDPESVPVLINLGALLRDRGRLDEAEASYRAALALDPGSVGVLANLGMLLRDRGRFDEALASYRKALAREPDHLGAWKGLVTVLEDQGQTGEALSSLRAALAVIPGSAELYSSLLAFGSYHCLLAPAEYLAHARGWERAVIPEAERSAARARAIRAAPLAGRRLRLGYVSGDFKLHAVSYFIEQIFRHHDRARIELFAYSNHGWSDAATERIRSHTDHWVQIEKMSDAEVRDKVEADRIDVLVNLSGHTTLNRMGVFARRAAPVQAEYLGGLGSSGLTEMDYWLGDAFVAPPETDATFSERVWRLPRVWVSYEGKAEAPAPGWRSAADGAVWLGSFNQLSKLTPATLALWARVLQALPEGRLLLKARQLADAGNRKRILESFSAHGIAADRIELQDAGTTPAWAAHMAYYDRLDIALDPVGAVGGGTTTCDALWMGVPVVTLAGDRMVSRMTTSMLNALGHPEWVAGSEAEYVTTAVALARDVEARKRLRAAQRGKMAGSPLCDALGLARCLEDAYAGMFERWQGSASRPAAAVS